MPDNPLDEMAKISASDSRGNLDGRIDRERRVQNRARQVRRICRWTVIIGGLFSLGGLFFGILMEIPHIAGLGCTLMLPTLIAGIVLFFMGGMAPGRTRAVLSDRERQRLDD